MQDERQWRLADYYRSIYYEGVVRLYSCRVITTNVDKEGLYYTTDFVW